MMSSSHDHEFSDQYKFGEVVRYPGEENPHDIDVTLPDSAFPIVSDYRSRFTTYGELRSKYGLPPRHTGMDVAAPIGTPVLAAADGVVCQSDYEPFAGQQVKIAHNGEQSQRTTYIHLSRRIVDHGQRVVRGQLIGMVGITGDGASGMVPHLHFALWHAPRSKTFRLSNPHKLWYGGPGRVTLYEPGKDYTARPENLTYPIPGREHLEYFVNLLEN
jgi:murein DD-endopeptidase MepM/ murein hydrolase activator NlpD